MTESKLGAGAVVRAAGRLVAAVYVWLLLTGPGPFGFNSFFWKKASFLSSREGILLVGLAQVILPSLVAGFLAGPRLGIAAVLVGFVLLGALTPLFLLFLPFVLLACACAWYAGWVSGRAKTEESLGKWRYWPALGVAFLALLVYTYTLGPAVALRNLRSKFAKDWPADASKIKAHPAGAYVAVDGITGCTGCGFPDTYYTDPTGLVFLYKCNLD